jgi:hypothetical protein
MIGAYVAGFDIDGVIGDFVSRFIDVVRDTYGIDLRADDIRGHDLFLALGIGKAEAVGLIRKTLEHPDYALYPGARDGLRQLADAGVEIHIITARWNGQADAGLLTERWLAAQGLERGTHYHRIDAVKEGKKFEVDASLDCFVDDNLVELLEMADQRSDVTTLIVYDHPWNQTVDVHARFRRVYGWSDLVALIVGEARTKADRSTATS